MRKFIYILLSVTLSTQLLSGQSRTITLEDSREMALEASFNLKSSLERISIAEDILSAYKSNHLPNFSLSGNYFYSTSTFDATINGGYLPTFVDGVYDPTTVTYMPDQKFEFEVGSIYNIGVMATQPIYMGGKVSNAIKLAGLGVDVSNLNRRVSEVEVLEFADNAFYQLLEVEEMLLSAQRYEAVVKEFHRQMESGYNRGMKTRNDLLKIGVRLNEAKLMSLKAQNGLRLARMNFCYAVGLPLMTTDITLIDPILKEYKVENDELDITSRPEYEMLSRQIEAKELEVKITRAEFLPSLSAIASYGYMGGAKLNGNTLLGGSSFMGGVSMNVPLFHWGEGRRKTAAKRREINIAQNQMNDMSQLMTLELMQAINNYNESRFEVELANESVAQAEENMRLSKNQYDAGMETIADYLESQALWQKAMSDLCSARSKQRSAYTKYLRCSGEL